MWGFFVICYWDIPQYGGWQDWNLFQIKVSRFCQLERSNMQCTQLQGQTKGWFLGMHVLWFQWELWAVIQHIWKILNLLKEHKLLSDPRADVSYLPFLSLCQSKGTSRPFLLEQRKYQAFKTCLWLARSMTQGLSPNSFCPVEVSFAEGTGREEKAARRRLLCWALALYLRSQPLCHRSCFTSFWPLDKSFFVMYTKWVQVSW